ncbi:MAG TPA: ROK family protein [Hanamia sp.]
MDYSSLVAGVDIGGSHIAAALVDLEARSVLPGTFIRKSIDSHGSANEIILQWSSLIQKIFDRSDCDKKVGIAMPGPFGYQSGISLIKDQNKYDSLYGLNVKSLLAESLQIKETDILFRNDAACFLQGEAFGGAAKGFKKAIGLTLGTGLGSAKYANGVSEDADLWQSPFVDGIAEDYLSSRWFVKRCYQLTGITVQNVKELIKITNADSLNRIFNEFGKNLALFLSRLILLEKPEVIVFGGNIANAYPLFYDALNSNLPTNAPPFSLKEAELGEQGSLIGAASCWYLK